MGMRMEQAGGRGLGFTWLKVIVALGAAGLAPGGTTRAAEVTGWVSDGQRSIPYRVFEPANADAGEKLPLILYLHGMGERGTDNVQQANSAANLIKATRSGAHAAYVLAPQIASDMWFQSWTRNPTQATALTLKALEQVQATENVDTSRIYVTGISMGGMGAWDVVGRAPTTFAAAVPIAGGGDVKTAAAVAGTPVWAFHGGADNVVPVSATRDMVVALQRAGGDVKYSEVAGGGHVIWNDIYADGTLYDWMFAQTRDVPLVPTRSTAAALPEPVTAVAASAPTPGVVAIVPIPEPSALGILAVAAGALLRRRRR